MLLGVAPYWLVYSFASAASLLPTKFPRLLRRGLWTVSFFALVAFVGLRHEVGGDWGNYLRMMENARGQPFLVALGRSDPGYALLNWWGINKFGGIYFVNTVCGAISLACLMYFCSKQPIPSLALAVAVPYLVVVVFMGYTRQGVALGLVMLALLAASNRRVGSFFIFCLAGLLFHRSAVIALTVIPAILVNHPRGISWVLIMVTCAACLALTAVLFADRTEAIWRLYLSIDNQGAALHSHGALARLSVSAIAAACFVFIALHTGLRREEFWVWAIIGLWAVTLLVVAIVRSTLADRLGIYTLPLQIYTFTRLAVMFPKWERIAISGCILVTYGLLLGVWLGYGSHAERWIPYQSMLVPYSDS